MKCSKTSNKISNQPTLTESWFSKKEFDTELEKKNGSGENDENLISKKSFQNIKISKISIKNTSHSKLNSNFENKKEFLDKENISDDSEIIGSSQEKIESKLKKKFNKTLKKKSVTPKSTPQKVDILSPDSIYKKLNISDICEVIIKDEFIEMFNNTDNYESIEMTHDLSGLIANNDLSSNVLESSQPIFNHSIDIDLMKQEEKNEQQDELMEDPLYIDEKDKEKVDKIFNLNTSERKMSIKTSTSNKICSPIKQKLRNYNKSISPLHSDGSVIATASKKTKKYKLHKEQDEALPKEILQKLNTLQIKLQHEVPPQHKIENNAGSRPLTQEQIIEFENYGPLKKGAYTQSEDKIIKKNWKQFCNIHEWNEKDVTPFLNMRHNGKYYIPELSERKKFVRFLANGLHWRSLHSVYFRFKNLYTTVSNGKYTPEEDRIIISHMCNASTAGLNNKCAEVANILKRKRQSIWQHFQKLKSNYDFPHSKNNSDDNESDDWEKAKKKKKKYSFDNKRSSQNFISEKVYSNVKWTSPLVKKYIDILKEVTSCEELNKLKYYKIDDNLWNEMERKMSINREILKNFWNNQLHMQLFCPKPIYLNDIKIKLIEYMYEKEQKALENIKWESVCSHFDGITTVFLSKLFDRLIQYGESKVGSSKLENIIEYLYKIHVSELEEKSVDAVLPKLHYKSGKIICLDKGTEKKVPNRIAINPLSDEE